MDDQNEEMHFATRLKRSMPQAWRVCPLCHNLTHSWPLFSRCLFCDKHQIANVYWDKLPSRYEAYRDNSLTHLKFGEETCREAFSEVLLSVKLSTQLPVLLTADCPHCNR
jgi:hypothetical protein